MKPTNLRRLLAHNCGVAATEYALVASLIAVAAASAIFDVGSDVQTNMEQIETATRTASR